MKDTFNLTGWKCRSKRIRPNATTFISTKSILLFYLFLLLAVLVPLQAQQGFCGFDEAHQKDLHDNPELRQAMESNEKRLQEFIKQYTKRTPDPSEKSGGNGVYTIPVVFHVIHTGAGSQSDISPGLCDNAIQELNNDFGDSLHTNVEIQFCLAQRDPDGNPTSGVVSIDGTGTANYENIGISKGANGNEVEVKALSVWPNTDYMNVWVVHNITGSSGPTLGYATFPGTSPAIDGVVIRFDAVGTSTYSNALTHEVGHFLDLYHTFEGGSSSTCPANSDCNGQGDRICDTPPHKLAVGGCDSTSLNACDNNSSIGLVAHNHMNYTENDCRYEFTDSQAVRMRCALLTLRHPLTYSIGCEPGCTTTVSSIIVDSTGVDTLTLVTFTSGSTGTGTLTYSWLIDGEEKGNGSTFQHIFEDPGRYEVCLDVTGSDGCKNRSCVTMTAFPVCSPSPNPCEKVLNGSFEQINSSTGSSNNFAPVCGWDDTNSSPFYCNLPENNAVGLYLYSKFQNNTLDNSNVERVTSELPLDLKPFSEYTITFDYLTLSAAPENILIGLTETNDIGVMPSDANIIAEVSNISLDVPGSASELNHTCYPKDSSFQKFSSSFIYPGDGRLFLNISGTPSSYIEYIISGTDTFELIKFDTTVFFIDNLSIIGCETTDCTPIPDFEIDQDSCSVTFMAYETGGGGIFHWDFGYGPVAGNEQVVTHEFVYGDTFDVCLTITCEENPAISEPKCEQVIIPESCNQCDTLSNQVPAIICEVAEDSTATNQFISNFTIGVPDGYGPCEEGGTLHITSEEVEIVVTDFDIDTLPSGTDDVFIIAQMTPPPGYDFVKLGAYGVVTFCSDSSVICREFFISADTCDNCMATIETEAVCNDSLSSDSIFVYEGTAIIPISSGPPTVELCQVNSIELGFNVDSAYYNGNEWVVEYSITTSDSGPIHTSALLCFYDNDFEQQFCYPLAISASCDILPEDCVQEWAVKAMTCDTIISDTAIFYIPNMVVTGNGLYSICEGGLFGTIDGGGSVVVDTGWVNGTSLGYSITLLMPLSSFVSGDTFDLRLYLCDDSGNPLCYLMPHVLSCDTRGGGEGGEGGGLRITNSGYHTVYSIHPNPANDRLKVVYTGDRPDLERELVLMDHLGRMVKRTILSVANQEINVSGLNTGIYFVAILEGGLPVQTEKVAIIR